MSERCPSCGCYINDNTHDCPNCGYRVCENRMRVKLNILEEAIKGWQAQNELLMNSIKTWKETALNMHRMACSRCDGINECKGCPFNLDGCDL